jgi:hypothetical protein
MYEPGRWINRVSLTPFMMVVAARDTMAAPADVALAAYERVYEPKRLQLVPGDHFRAVPRPVRHREPRRDRLGFSSTFLTISPVAPLHGHTRLFGTAAIPPNPTPPREKIDTAMPVSTAPRPPPCRGVR